VVPCCLNVIFLRTTRSASGRAIVLAAALLLTLLAVVLASPASARSSTLESPADMSLAFVSETAHRVGSQALLLVECDGPRTGTCVGTVTLSVAGQKQKVPFSIFGGSSQSLTVPLGTAPRSARRGLAVARTLQMDGRVSRASAVMRFH
jgi:hypothetical protein